MRQLAVSVHDVSPRFEKELDTIFSALDKAGVPIRTELVVPNYKRRFHLADSPDFTSILKEHSAHGCDISLHGLHHDYAEFHRLNYYSAENAMRQGLDIFSETLCFRPTGFVAPQWLQNKESMKAVWNNGFTYTATLFGIHFQNGSPLRAFPINYDWGLYLANRTALCLNALSCRFRRRGLIRFSLHPMDITHGLFNTEMKHLQTLLDHDWMPTTYAQLAKEF